MSQWIIDGEDGSTTVDTAKDDLSQEQLEGYYQLGDLDAGARLRDIMSEGLRLSSI